MYTSSISRNISLVVVLAVLFVSSAAAQNRPGNNDSFLRASDFATDAQRPDNLTNIIADISRAESISLDLPSLTSLEWQAFGMRLETALASSHRGLQHSALRLIIAYGKHFDLSESAVFDVMRLYRDGDSQRVRRMAVVALAQVHSKWAIKFLEHSVRFEKSPQVQHTIRAVLNEISASA